MPINYLEILPSFSEIIKNPEDFPLGWVHSGNKEADLYNLESGYRIQLQACAAEMNKEEGFSHAHYKRDRMYSGNAQADSLNGLNGEKLGFEVFNSFLEYLYSRPQKLCPLHAKDPSHVCGVETELV